MIVLFSKTLTTSKTSQELKNYTPMNVKSHAVFSLKRARFSSHFGALLQTMKTNTAIVQQRNVELGWVPLF